MSFHLCTASQFPDVVRNGQVPSLLRLLEHPCFSSHPPFPGCHFLFSFSLNSSSLSTTFIAVELLPSQEPLA